jgi:spore maturation protein CgeB
MEHAYGDPARGPSYEYTNVFTPLRHLYETVELFDFVSIARSEGVAAMNQRLIAEVQAKRPDVVVFCLFQEEFDPEALKRVRELSKTMVIYLDDNWRVEYSRRWAQHFDLYASADIDGVRKFADAGLPHAYFFPFGCDPRVYRPLGLPKVYDVSFVGSFHPRRQWEIRQLEKAGLKVHTAGFGWPNGPASHEEMIRIFNQSRINLNLSNSRTLDARYVISSLRAFKDAIRSVKTVEQLKARHFELNGCRAFQLSQYTEGLERVYRIGEEIAIFTSPDDLVDKVRYFLAHGDRAEAIAEAGYRRTLADHTIERYFSGAFERLGVLHSQPPQLQPDLG